MSPNYFHRIFNQSVRIFPGVDVEHAIEGGAGDFCGPALHTDIDEIVGAGLERGPERAF